MLASGTATYAGATISLNDSISNYKYIVGGRPAVTNDEAIISSAYATQVNFICFSDYIKTHDISSVLIRGASSSSVIAGTITYSYVSDTQIKMKVNWSGGTWPINIYGVK